MCILVVLYGYNSKRRDLTSVASLMSLDDVVVAASHLLGACSVHNAAESSEGTLKVSYGFVMFATEDHGGGQVVEANDLHGCLV